jgi:multidrug resistance efflux pump
MVARCALVLATLAFACRDNDITTDRYQGMVELEQTDVAFEIGGKIAELDVVAGQPIRKGQPIAKLDDTIDRQTRALRERDVASAKADLALVVAGARSEDIRASQAEVEAARSTENQVALEVERERTLVAQGATPRSRLDELEAQLARARGQSRTTAERLAALAHGARAEEVARYDARVAAAEASLALADRVLDKHVIASPIDGFVVDVPPHVGEVVVAGTPIAMVVDRTRPYADVFVPVADLPSIHVGVDVEVAVEGDPRFTPGVVERVFPQLEFTPRFVYSPRERPNLVARVRVRLHDRDAFLHAGQPIYAQLAERRREARR